MTTNLQQQISALYVRTSGESFRTAPLIKVDAPDPLPRLGVRYITIKGDWLAVGGQWMSIEKKGNHYTVTLGPAKDTGSQLLGRTIAADFNLRSGERHEHQGFTGAWKNVAPMQEERNENAADTIYRKVEKGINDAYAYLIAPGQ